MQAHIPMRVICNAVGCGYKSRDTYDSNATAAMTAAYRLATTHARVKHPGMVRHQWVREAAGKNCYVVLVTVEPDKGA